MAGLPMELSDGVDEAGLRVGFRIEVAALYPWPANLTSVSRDALRAAIETGPGPWEDLTARLLAQASG
jgi:hypothetical protein